MTQTGIYEDIAKRTGGDIYIGVVGPVRSGKSTFIGRFMESVILPNMDNEYERERAKDEMPQSAGGRTVMTTEPKFVPDEAVSVHFGDSHLKMKLVDCVGFIVPSAAGQSEDGHARMVMTPWSPDSMPFKEAAELGTKKVITDHATIGMVVTTDGTIGEIPRADYEEAEQRVIAELQAIGKPFAIILNSKEPESEQASALAYALEEKYHAPVALLNCLEMDAQDVQEILSMVLAEFPVREIRLELPQWVSALGGTHWLWASLRDRFLQKANQMEKMGELSTLLTLDEADANVESVTVVENDLGKGKAQLRADVPRALYYQIVSEMAGMEIGDDATLMKTVAELSTAKRRYDTVAQALDQVERTGYGIVVPSVQEMQLQEPDLLKGAGGYGVRLCASAPSIHMIRANIETEISPIVGTKEQSEELLSYLQREMEQNPQGVWEYSIFGKTLQDLLEDGLARKLSHMPEQARTKLCETLERAINEGSGGLICILL